MKKGFLRTVSTHTKTIVDKDSGEMIDHEIISHTYLANSKEEFVLAYASLLGVFQNASTAEVRVYSYLLQNYSSTNMIVINGLIRKDIAAKTGLKPGSINNTLGSLISTKERRHPLVVRLGRGTYQLNPRYAFKGSSQMRNQSLKSIIELGCDRC